MSASISDFDLNVIDNLSVEGFYAMTFFGLTLASIDYMAKQFEIKMNWSSVRNIPDATKYSWLWSNVENKLKGAITDAEEQITQQIVMNPVVKSLDDATNKMNDALANVSKDVKSLKEKVDDAEIYKDKKSSALAVSLQNNILALKEGMQKVIASLIVQRHISNGTIKMMNGTRSLQESVRLAVNKVSGQNPKVAPLTESIIKEELPESGTSIGPSNTPSIGPPRPVPSSTVLPPSVSPILQPDSTTDAAPPMPPVSAPSKKKKKK
jgi:hypothetical protein